LSSPAQATLGMRILGPRGCARSRRQDRLPHRAAHALLFYIFGATMTPLILLVGLLRQDRALLARSRPAGEGSSRLSALIGRNWGEDCATHLSRARNRYP